MEHQIKLGPSQDLSWIDVYASDGFALVAVEPAAKKPYFPFSPHAARSANSSSEAWARWIAEKPNLNIGVATGAVSGNLLCLDFDSRAHYEALIEQVALPPTREEETGNGVHLYYRFHGQMPHGRRSFPGLLDVLWDGKYVVTAPSVHSLGTPYRSTMSPIAELDASTLEQVIEFTANAAGVPAGVHQRSITSAGGTTFDHKRVVELMRDGLRVGSRHEGFVFCLGQFAAVGLMKQEALERLKVIFEVTDQPEGDEYRWADVERLVEDSFSSFKGALLNDSAYRLDPYKAGWARTHWNPDKVRRERGTLPTFEDHVEECLRRLDELEIPVEISVRQARRELQQHDLGMRNDVLTAAVKRRKDQCVEAVTVISVEELRKAA